MYLTKTQLLTKGVHTPGPGAESRPLFLLSPFLLRKPGSGSNSPSSFHSCSEKKEGREEKSEWPGNHDLPPSADLPTAIRTAIRTMPRHLHTRIGVNSFLP